MGLDGVQQDARGPVGRWQVGLWRDGARGVLCDGSQATQMGLMRKHQARVGRARAGCGVRHARGWASCGVHSQPTSGSGWGKRAAGWAADPNGLHAGPAMHRIYRSLEAKWGVLAQRVGVGRSTGKHARGLEGERHGRNGCGTTASDNEPVASVFHSCLLRLPRRRRGSCGSRWRVEEGEAGCGRGRSSSAAALRSLPRWAL